MACETGMRTDTLKIFVAGIATETNTFVTMPTGMKSFEAGGIVRGNARDQDQSHPLTDRLRQLAASEGHAIVIGLLAAAQPLGPTLRSVYESLRDELLNRLQAAMPVQAVILPLHGAMVAEGYPDCEGDLIERVRAIVGPQVAIGVELDLHCHFTEKMRRFSDVIVAYKEYPHTDVVERLEEVWRLTMDTAAGRIAPVISVHDCRMVSFWHTTREPMVSFVQRMKALEGRDGVLSVSFGHGFPYGDTEDSGAKIWVITNGKLDPGGARGAALAGKLGREIWDLRDQTRPVTTSLDEALDQMLALPADRLVVLADRADNAGGGAPSDSTFVLRRLLERGIGNVALGAFWDLGAIHTCFDVGVGATLDLRVGGKASPVSGEPVDLRVTVKGLAPSLAQNLPGYTSDCGPSAWVQADNGLDLVLISNRQQVIRPELFTDLGVALSTKRAVVVKSSQHFHAAFAPLAQVVIYVDTPGLLRNDMENLPFRHRNGNYWPRVDDPWKDAV